jgi:hypothetical protein
MDMSGKINPPSSKGHQFVLAITDYFTKWVINFVIEHIIHRFGIR